MSEKKSNFAVTCSLLSQYLKKKGSFKELRLQPQEPNNRGLNPPPTTMNLLPGVDVSSEKQNNEASTALFPQNTETKDSKKGPLTIFYSGKVLVLDNFPSEKIDDLVEFAAKESSTSFNSTRSSAEQLPEKKPCTAPSQNNPELPMPIARRASLHRFYEKRKDRIRLKAPYQVNEAQAEAGSSKPEESPSWLSLSQNFSKSTSKSSDRKE